MDAPEHLSEDAKRWWLEIQEGYAISDPGGLLLLQVAIEAYDRLLQAQQAIEADGPQVEDRFGQRKAHPLLAVERDSRGQMLAALRALNLDMEPGQPGPGCPPNRYGGMKKHG